MPSDTLSGMVYTVVDDAFFSAKDDFCDWQFAEHPNDERAAQADLANRKQVVRAAYNKMLDELTAPLLHFQPTCTGDDTIDPNKVSAAELEDWMRRGREHRSDRDCLQ